MMLKMARTVAVALALAGAAWADEPDVDAEAWSGVFEQRSVRYDVARAVVTWELEVTADCKRKEFTAMFRDPDGVEVGTVPVKFTPAERNLKAGTKVRAVAKLGSSCGEPTRVMVQKAR